MYRGKITECLILPKRIMDVRHNNFFFFFFRALLNQFYEHSNFSANSLASLKFKPSDLAALRYTPFVCQC